MPALPAAERARLEQAYRATTYRVNAPSGDIDLRLGEPSPALAALLSEAGVVHWAIVTAWNPASRLRDTAANEAARARLHEWLSGKGYCWLPGANCANAGDWPPEVSCVVLGMPEAAALQCGSEFGQIAVVTGDGEAIPRLNWCC